MQWCQSFLSHPSYYALIYYKKCRVKVEPKKGSTFAYLRWEVALSFYPQTIILSHSSCPLLHKFFQSTLSFYTLLYIMFSHWYCVLLNHTFSLALHHVDGFAKKSALHFHKTFNLMQNSLPDLILYCLPNYIQTYLFVQYRKQLWMFCQKNWRITFKL